MFPNNILLPVTAKCAKLWSPVFVPLKFEPTIVPLALILPEAVIWVVSILAILVTVSVWFEKVKSESSANLPLVDENVTLPSVKSFTFNVWVFIVPLELISPEAVIEPLNVWVS